MDYTPKSIDIPAFEAALGEERKYRQQQRALAMKEAEAFYNGYDAAITDVISMLHCSNYEKKEELA